MAAYLSNCSDSCISSGSLADGAVIGLLEDAQVNLLVGRQALQGVLQGFPGLLRTVLAVLSYTAAIDCCT